MLLKNLYIMLNQNGADLWIIVNRVTILYIGFEDFPNVVDEANRKMVVRHFSPGEFESHYLKRLQL